MSTELLKRLLKVFFNKKTFYLVLLLLLLCACSVVRGSGNVITETRTVSDFDQVELNDQGEVILKLGEQESLVLEAEDNIIAVVETEVRGNTLYIGTKSNKIINPTKPVRYFLTMKEISALKIFGSGSITADKIMTDRLTLNINGSGDISIGSLSAESLEVDISGSGDVEVAGQTTSQTIKLSGSGNHQAADLETEVVDVEVNGSGGTTVWANQTLSVEINGSGSVNYYGSPTVSQSISGSGDLKDLGNR